MADDWSHGYDVSVPYTYGFGREMAPAWLDLAVLLAGHRPPRAPGAPFRYLDLGAGQGQGLCLLAATNPQGEFVGIDYHAEHVAHGRGVAAAAGLANVRFEQADFLELAEDWPAALGSFDYVVLHGVYSWVSPQVRAAVAACVGHAVRPGGLVYNGYNAQPGWLATAPFQHVARALKETTGKPAQAVMDQAVALFDALRTGGATTFEILPGLAGRLDKVRGQRTAYLAAEYLGEHWHPLWHSAVARELAGAGLGYVGSATLAETMLPDPLPPALRQAILAQPDPALRQDVQDFVINQFFRRDLFQRDAAPAAVDDAAIARTRLHLVAPPAAGQPLRFDTAFAQITLEPPAFAGVLAALAAGPRTIAELVALPDMKQHGTANARQIVLLLVHAGVLAIGGDEIAAQPTAHALNAVIARGAAAGTGYDHVAAPALGGAVPADERALLLLDAWLAAPGADAATLARAADDRLAALGRPAAGQAGVAAFLGETLPRWRALGAVA